MILLACYSKLIWFLEMKGVFDWWVKDFITASHIEIRGFENKKVSLEVMLGVELWLEKMAWQRERIVMEYD